MLVFLIVLVLYPPSPFHVCEILYEKCVPINDIHVNKLFISSIADSYLFSLIVLEQKSVMIYMLLWLWCMDMLQNMLHQQLLKPE